MLPLPVIRKTGQLLVECLHELIKSHDVSHRPSSSSGEKSDILAPIAVDWQLGTLKTQNENCCNDRGAPACE
jgi:hypothetical protein